MSIESPTELVHRQKALRGLGLALTHIRSVKIPPAHDLAIEDLEVAHGFLQEACNSNTYDRVLEVYTAILDTEHLFLTYTMSDKECAELVRTFTALRAYVLDILTRFE